MSDSELKAAPWNDSSISIKVLVSVSYDREVEISVPADYCSSDIRYAVQTQINKPLEWAKEISTQIHHNNFIRKELLEWEETNLTITE